MNNSKMWLVVKPTVGIPLFLSAVAVGSFAVHVAVLTNTSWVGDFLQGQPLGTGDAQASLAPAGDATLPAQASYSAPQAEGQTVLVIMPDGTTARAVLETPATLAALDGSAPRVIEQ
jgi:light-harvesting protein B-800-850 alpha chain